MCSKKRPIKSEVWLYCTSYFVRTLFCCIRDKTKPRGCSERLFHFEMATEGQNKNENVVFTESLFTMFGKVLLEGHQTDRLQYLAVADVSPAYPPYLNNVFKFDHVSLLDLHCNGSHVPSNRA